jgi:sugar phosphate isomerase/epimerase
MARSVRRQVEWAGTQAFAGVVIDATHPESRPRDLDRSARRDLAALLRRVELRAAGVELWIPQEHFRSSDHLERALQAVQGACSLAADLASLTSGDAVVHLQLPATPFADAIEALADASQRLGVRIADYAWPVTSEFDPAGLVGLGLDPAAVLTSGADPVQAVLENAQSLIAARLSDVSRSGPTVPGAGRLDLHGYIGAVSTTIPSSPIILDLRGVPDPLAGAESLADSWRRG